MTYRKLSYEERVDAAIDRVRYQPIQDLVPHILRWIDKDKHAWDYFEEWYVDELVNQKSDYDGNGYEG
jgi:uncharacterized protein YeaO (DUF488 family)